MRESTILQLVRLAASKIGLVTFRNNVGLAHEPDGNPIRYGLCRGSSDLIGWKQHTVRPQDVGRRVAVFVAIETKSARGRATEEQKNFLAQVKRAGGIAVIARGPDHVADAITDWERGVETSPWM